MHLTKMAIQNTERIRRLNIINSISGIKPANLIGTSSNSGQSNLSIFSSVIHLGSDPALVEGRVNGVAIYLRTEFLKRA